MPWYPPIASSSFHIVPRGHMAPHHPAYFPSELLSARLSEHQSVRRIERSQP